MFVTIMSIISTYNFIAFIESFIFFYCTIFYCTTFIFFSENECSNNQYWIAELWRLWSLFVSLSLSVVMKRKGRPVMLLLAWILTEWSTLTIPHRLLGPTSITIILIIIIMIFPHREVEVSVLLHVLTLRKLPHCLHRPSRLQCLPMSTHPFIIVGTASIIMPNFQAAIEVCP